MHYRFLLFSLVWAAFYKFLQTVVVRSLVCCNFRVKMKPKVTGVHNHGMSVDLQEVCHPKDETAGVLLIYGMFSRLFSYMLYVCCVVP